MNKAEAKRYVEDITIMSMIISSSHSYIYIISFSSSTQSQVFSSVECFIHKQSKIFEGAFILRS